MSRSKDKGTRGETAVVDYLREHGQPQAERRALTGAIDKGDVTGMPGVCIEIKTAGRYDIPGWLVETRTETAASRADVGVLVVKPRGVGDTRVGDWWAITTLAEFVHLLRAAGYGDPLPEEGAA